jgi:hypothetical protein
MPIVNVFVAKLTVQSSIPLIFWILPSIFMAQFEQSSPSSIKERFTFSVDVSISAPPF